MDRTGRVAAFVGIGANLGDPARQVSDALQALARFGAVRASSLYRTEPEGDPAQPWYVNAVAALATSWSPRRLLAGLQELERAAGRPSRRASGGARTLDLDLLLFADRVISAPGLEVPHPRLHRRRFVLEPLAELDPEAMHPGLGRSVRELLARLDDPLRVEKLPGLGEPAPPSAGRNFW